MQHMFIHPTFADVVSYGCARTRSVSRTSPLRFCDPGPAVCLRRAV